MSWYRFNPGLNQLGEPRRFAQAGPGLNLGRRKPLSRIKILASIAKAGRSRHGSPKITLPKLTCLEGE